MITLCTADGCTHKTLGGLCTQHDPPVTRKFVRGRPFRAANPDRSKSNEAMLEPLHRVGDLTCALTAQVQGVLLLSSATG